MRLKRTMRGLIVDEGRLSGLLAYGDDATPTVDPATTAETTKFMTGQELLAMGVAALGIPSKNRLLRTGGWIAGGLCAISILVRRGYLAA